MTKNYLSPGAVQPVTAPAAVSAGDFVQVNQMTGFAAHDAAISTTVEIYRTGKHLSAECTSAETWAIGELIYWDGTEFSNAAPSTGDLLVGYVGEIKAPGTTTGVVILDGVARVDVPA